jgi:tetratricopeptide (TPR) repeat protein
MINIAKNKQFGIVVFLWLFSTALYAQSAGRSLSTTGLRSMARAYMAFAQYDKARDLAEQALRQAKTQNVEIGEMALCLIDLGTVYSYEGLLKEAQEKLEQGSLLQRQALFNDHPYVAHTLRMLSDVHRRQGDLVKAEAVLSEAFQIMLKNCDLQSQEMAPFIAEAAHLQFAQGDLDKAQSNYIAALDLYESSYGVNHLVTANLQENYAKLLITEHDYAQAEELLTKSLTVKTRIFGRYHLSLVDNWLAKAYLYQIQGKTEQCEFYLSKSTATAAESRNVVTIARIYEKVNQIRAGGLLASAEM